MKRRSSLKMLSSCAAVFALDALTVALSRNSQGMAHAATPPAQTVRIQYYPGVVFQQTLQVAKDRDLFSSANINVQLINSKSGPEGLAGVISGSLDLASTNIDTFLAAAARGANVRAVAATSGPYFSLLLQSGFKQSLPSGDWRAIMKELVGKRLGVTARGSGTETFYRALFSSAGLDPSSATYVAIGQGATALSAFQSKQVDSIMAYQPLTELLLASGAVMGIDIANGQGPKEITELGATVVYFGTQENLDSKRAAIQAFVEKLTSAAEWSRNAANIDALVALMKPHVLMTNADNPDAMLRKVIQNSLKATTLTTVNSEDLGHWVSLLNTHANMDLPKDPSFVKRLVW